MPVTEAHELGSVPSNGPNGMASLTSKAGTNAHSLLLTSLFSGDPMALRAMPQKTLDIVILVNLVAQGSERTLEPIN